MHPPRHVAVLVNPVSARGRGARVGLRVVRALRDAGVRTSVLVGPDAVQARDLAAKAVHGSQAGTLDALVAVGGDGLVHEALQVLAGTDTPLGVVPAGSGNDACRILGVPPGSPEAAVRVVLDGWTRRIDLARCDGRYYATVLASGFDSFVNERANAMRWPRGQLRYTVAVAAELRAFKPLRYTVDLDGDSLTTEAMLVAVGNGPSYGGGLRITEGADPCDGLLDVAVIGPVSRVELVRAFPRLYSGSIVHHPAYEHHRARRVTLAAPGVVAYADGERIGPLPLTISCVPGALRVLGPPSFCHVGSVP